MVRSLKSYLLFHILQKHSLDVLELISSQLTLLYTPVHKHHSSLISTTSTVSKKNLDLWLNLIAYNKLHHPKRTRPSKLSPTHIFVYHWPFPQRTHTHMQHMTLYPKSIDRQTDRHGKTHDARLQRCRQYSLQSYLKERLANIFRMGVGVWGVLLWWWVGSWGFKL